MGRQTVKFAVYCHLSCSPVQRPGTKNPKSETSFGIWNLRGMRHLATPASSFPRALPLSDLSRCDDPFGVESVLSQSELCVESVLVNMRLRYR